MRAARCVVCVGVVFRVSGGRGGGAGPGPAVADSGPLQLQGHGERSRGCRGQVWAEKGIRVSGQELPTPWCRALTPGARTKHAGLLGGEQQKLPLATLSSTGRSSPGLL